MWSLAGWLAASCIAVGCKSGGDDGVEGTTESAGEASAPSAPETPVDPRESPLFEPLPTSVEVNSAQAELGRRLYHDPHLSGDGTLSCASCHDIAEGGDDGLAVSVGIAGQQGPINAPTVLNSAYNVAQFWDGRAATLEEQAAGPVGNPIEMGADWEQVVAYLAQDPTYADAFANAYEDGVTQANATHAIAEFERSLITPNSRFDQYLRGDDEALTDEEKAGFQLFFEVGCATCHNGPALGGRSFQRMGAVNDYFADRGEVTEPDYGRFNATGDEADRFHFKVPILRNVELTAPYLHDASAETLEEAVLSMGHYQLGRDLTEAQVAQIVAFLRTLTGDIPDVAM
jgi:cytochrome c peroxidase